jgi:hypothetical protein
MALMYRYIWPPTHMYLYIRDIHFSYVYIEGGHMYLYIRDIHFNSVYIVGGHMYLYIRDIHLVKMDVCDLVY